MSRNELMSRGPAPAAAATKGERVASTAPVDTSVVREFSEILSHRQRVADGSTADESAGRRREPLAARESETAVVPSMFLHGQAPHVARRPIEETPTPSLVEARPAPEASTVRTAPTPGAEAGGAPAPLVPEAIVETLLTGWSKARTAASGARSWSLQIRTPGSDASLEIELSADGAWHVRVRDESTPHGGGHDDAVDARFAGVARDAGHFCAELEARLGQSRPELRFSAAEA